MTVSSTTKRNSYTGNGSTTTFAYSFKIFDDDDITVILRTTATGTETVQTKTTHYSVTGVGSASGGNVVFGSAPTSAQTVVLLRQTAQTQATDYTPNDPFPAASHEDALDKLTLMTQDQQDELDRSIKLSRTNTMTSTEFTVTATNRANKIFAFDSSGELSVTQEIGTFRGDWAASTSYAVRDLVKDTSTNNIFIVNEAHTSSGSQPLTTNANSAKYDLIVDAAAATTSASAAASSATAAASSASTASTQASNASSSASTASTQATNSANSATASAASATAAASSATAAATALDNFDDIFLGAKSSDPSTDNDGDALTTGDIYFNTSSNTLRVFNGSSFQDASISTTATTAELNIMDGDTSASSTTVADADRVVFNDAGTMKQVAVTDLAAYFDDEITAMPNLVTTGALNSGSITSGFGAIDNGSSNITTTGVGSFGSLDISGDIDVDGTTNLDVVDIDGAVDMASTLQVDGAITSSAGATITTADNSAQLILKSTDADANAGPFLKMQRDSGSPADGDIVGVLNFTADDDGGNEAEFGRIFTTIVDASNGTEDGKISHRVTMAGTPTVVLDLDASGAAVTGGITATAASTITTADNTAQLTLISTDADANVGPLLVMKRDSSSPADNDILARIDFKGDNDAGEETFFGSINAIATDVSDGTENAQIKHRLMVGGAVSNVFELNSSEIIFNEDSKDLDFRVESDEHGHAFFLQGSSGNISMGVDTPTLDSSLAGVSVPAGTRLFQIHDTDGSCIKLSDPSSGVNRGAAVAIIGTNMIINNCEADAITFGTGNTYRARITSGGRLQIGTTTGNPGSGNSSAGIELRGDIGDAFFSRTDGDAGYFNRNNDGSVVTFSKGGTAKGNVAVSDSGVAFNTSSDYRLKENVTAITNATDRLKQLNPVRFNFIADPDKTVDGFLAHEAQAVVPEAITGTKDETRDVSNAILSSAGKLLAEDTTQDEWTAGKLATTDAEGNDVDALYPSDSTWAASHTEPVMQGIDQSKLVPLLVKTIQELEARITALEAG